MGSELFAKLDEIMSSPLHKTNSKYHFDRDDYGLPFGDYTVDTFVWKLPGELKKYLEVKVSGSPMGGGEESITSIKLIKRSNWLFKTVTPISVWLLSNDECNMLMERIDASMSELNAANEAAHINNILSKINE